MKSYLTLIIFLFVNSIFAQKTQLPDTSNIKTTELQEVIIINKKKAIEHKADKVIYNFTNQTYINSGSLMEGLKKISGLIISDVAGMMYQGKQLEVYIDGRPTNMYTDELNSYLESLPANAIDKIEIITQPGAEFPATSGGAILNIVTSKNAKKYLSATYSNGFSITNYDKNRTRLSNSILLNAKNNLFGWQIQLGQSYHEAYQKATFNTKNILISDNYFDQTNRLTFLNTGLKFDIKKDRLLVNYDISTNNNSNDINAKGLGFSSNDYRTTKHFRNDLMLTYQKRFNNTSKKLDFSLNLYQNENNFKLNNQVNNSSILENNSLQKFYQFKADFSQEINFLDKTKLGIGLLTDQLNFKTKSIDITNLEYFRKTFAGYSELQSSHKSFDFILGGRLESYEIDGTTNTNKLNSFKQTRFFPNASIQYNFLPEVYISANYNNKISLPNTSSLNPNNTNYQNQNISYYGNPNLNPTLFNNFELKISALEYLFLGYSLSNMENQIINRYSENSHGILRMSENIPKLSIHNFNFGIPVPFIIFTQGIKETIKMNFNPDEINFLSVYVNYQKYNIEGISSKGFWSYNLLSQIILPKEINFTLNFSTSTTDGNFYYNVNRKPIEEQLDMTFSKKFFSNNLSISIYVNDIFNSNVQYIEALGTNINFQSKYDSRRIGFSLNYKMPSKNKSVKEDNLIQSNKKEEKVIDK